MATVFGFDRNGNFDSDFAGDGGFVYLDDYNELKCYIDHLESRLAELEKDAARYRWLRDRPWSSDEFGIRLRVAIQFQMNAIWDEVIDEAIGREA